jgi:N-acyl-phosphatidylethanolamine-hydrolysing phospholipase D
VAPALLIAILLAFPALGAAEPSEAARDSGSLMAAHGEIGRFFNPWDQAPKRRGWGFLRWKLLSRNAYDKKRPPVIPRIPNDGASLSGVAPSPTLTWVGHATYAIHDGDDVVLTDPHFGEFALIRRRHSPPGIPAAAIPPDAFAVISHNHYDHLDASTVEALPETVGWYVPLGLGPWFRERGREDVVELDWWEQARRGRWTITCLPSQHWSRRGLGDINATLWCAWLIDSGSTRYFFAGDTGYFRGFAEYGRRFAPIDVALLPIGAYEPRWFMRAQHMNPPEAYRAFLDLKARTMLSMHWGTFDLTDEPLDLPPRALDEVVREEGGDPQRVRSLAIGERWELPARAKTAANE